MALITGWPDTRDITLPRNAAGKQPDPVAYILSLAAQPWTLSSLAHLLRDSGTLDIPSNAEAETAASLHWLLGIAILHGEDWAEMWDAERTSMQAAVNSKRSAS